MAFINAKNKVPEYQRFYQANYRNHQRLWKIHPRSKFLLTPFLVTMWGTLAVSLWGLGRRAAGYNSYWGKE